MTKLYFVGYNGYNQFPNNQKAQPKIISDWTSVVVNGTLTSCSHRLVSLETEKFLKIYGILNTPDKSFCELSKPAELLTVGHTDEFLIASEKIRLWKYSFNDEEWRKLELSFICPEHKSLWDGAGNSILKFSFPQNDTSVILLLSNGSVWLLSDRDDVKLIYPCDVDKAVDISSGLEHSLILTESGCVLSFGNGSRGQLGHGDLDPTSQPVQISALEGLKITKVATGGWHSCAVTDSGDLYTWGWNNFGQLSAFEDGKEIGLTALPVLVDVDESQTEVVDVACGRRHSIAVLGNGDLFSTGWNKYKQLGIEISCEKVSKFTKCTIQDQGKMNVSCGPWYTILYKNIKRT